MGGKGSGNWYRWNTKSTTEDCKQIDIRLMKREGWLNAGNSGTLSWKRNNNPWGDIEYRCYEDKLVLDYRHRINGGEWQPVTQTVFISETNCNFGNVRHWFICPNCDYRCAILYAGSQLFLCRKCYHLPYTSQMKGELDRLIEQKHKLGNLIFDDYSYGDGWLKKKGMHHKTFQKAYRRYHEMNIKINMGIAGEFN